MFLSRPSLLTRWPSRTTDLKNTSDDAIPNYLNSLKFRQSHTLTDVRLALGYSAFGIAAACFLWDYKLGFENTKHFTAAAVAVYTLVNTALTLWITFREKGVIYEGTSPSGEKVWQFTCHSHTSSNKSSPRSRSAAPPRRMSPFTTSPSPSPTTTPSLQFSSSPSLSLAGSTRRASSSQSPSKSSSLPQFP